MARGKDNPRGVERAPKRVPVNPGAPLEAVVSIEERVDALEAAPAGSASWSSLTGKPTEFPPEAHGHATADIPGLDADLAELGSTISAKQDAGDYALAGHGHVIADVTGLQGALDAKQAAGSYLTAVAWSDVSDKPSFLTATNTSRVLGRSTAGFGEPEQLTGVQVTAMLGTFDQTTKGLVPAPGTIAGRMLKDDGTWAAPPSGGGSDPWAWSKLAADIATTGTALTSSGLSFSASPNTTYIVRVVGGFTAAATTTGIAMALDIPSGVVVGTGYHLSTAAGASLGFEQIADNATVGVTTGVRAANTLTGIEASWIVEVGATGGTVALNFRSEVSGSAVTLKKPLGFGFRAI